MSKISQITTSSFGVNPLVKSTDMFFCPYRNIHISLGVCVSDYTDSNVAGVANFIVQCQKCKDGRIFRKNFANNTPSIPPSKDSKLTFEEIEKRQHESRIEIELIESNAVKIRESMSRRLAEEEAKRQAKVESKAKHPIVTEEQKKKFRKKFGVEYVPHWSTMVQYCLFIQQVIQDNYHSFSEIDPYIMKISGCEERGCAVSGWWYPMKKLGFVSTKNTRRIPYTQFSSSYMDVHPEIFNKAAKILGYKDLIIKIPQLPTAP